MRPLRHLSLRPELLVDHNGNRVGELVNNAVVTVVGLPAPLGRERVVEALPLNESETGPVQIAPHVAIHDQDSFYLADPDGNLIGVQGVWIHRLVYAHWVEDTRRLT